MKASLLGKLMINDVAANETAIDAIIDVNLQTRVNENTKNYLRLESIRRKVTMGQLLDEIVKLFSSGDVPKITS